MDRVTKQEVLNKYFTANSGMSKEKAIANVIEKFKVTESTAYTYYVKWRKEFMKVGTALINNGKRVPAIEKEEFKNLGKESKVTPVEETEPTKSNIPLSDPARPQINRLIPVHMVGKYGDYKFSPEGVQIIPCDDFLSNEKNEESLEALEVWGEYYTQE
jgi:hypothetical protein